MVSYADMITIIMAFFVVMFALSGRQDENSLRPVLSSLKQQFGTDWPFDNLPPGTFRSLMVPRDRVRRSTASETSVKGRISGPYTTTSRGAFRPGEGIVRGGLLPFDDGVVELTDGQKAQIRKVRADLDGKPQKIEIRGHAARPPLAKDSEYKDQWDIAYARAHAVMAYLISQNIDPHRIRIGVAGSNEPTGDRGQVARLDRSRVEIFMLNEFVEPR